MPELTATLKALRESQYQERKFLAALQGVDLDESASKSEGQTTFEDIKARVFSGGKATNADDILSLQGINAQQAGFGIGMGLDYAEGEEAINPLA